MLSDFFDTMGTLVGVGAQAGYVDENGHLEKLNRLLLVDSLAAVAGGAVSSSSATTYIESGSGVAAGGRTGWVGIIVGLLFLLAMFFSPIAGIVPANATAPALIIVGYLMMATLTQGETMAQDEEEGHGLVKRAIAAIDFSDIAFGIPAVLIMTIMPLTYSITNGIGFGFISYTLIRIFQGTRPGDQLDAVDRERRLHPLLPRPAARRPRAGSEPGAAATSRTYELTGRGAGPPQAPGPSAILRRHVTSSCSSSRSPSSSSPPSSSPTAWSGSGAATTWARAPWAASSPPWARRCRRRWCRSSPSSSPAAPRPRDVGVGAILGAPFMLSSLAMVVTGAAVVVFSLDAAAAPRDVTVNESVMRRDLSHFLIAYALAMAAGLIHVRPLHYAALGRAARRSTATTCGRRCTARATSARTSSPCTSTATR